MIILPPQQKEPDKLTQRSLDRYLHVQTLINSVSPHTMPVWNSLLASILLLKPLLWYLSRRSYPHIILSSVKGPVAFSKPGGDLCCRGRKGPGTATEGRVVFIW